MEDLKRNCDFRPPLVFENELWEEISHFNNRYFSITRSNPLYTEEEEQEVVIIVDSLDEVPEGEAPEPPRTPRRAPSTSSGQLIY